MNPKLLYFALGLLTGGAIGGTASALYFKNKYQKQYEDDIEYMEEYYQTMDKYRRVHKDDVEVDDDVNPVKTRESDETNTGREHGPLSKEQREEIKAKLDKNWEETTNYASMFNSEDYGGEPDDDEESPSLSEGAGNEANVDVDATEEHRKNRHKNPKIISSEAVGEMPAYFEREIFFFYKDDQTVADESGTVVNDPETYLGDCLTKYDFDVNEEERIFVVNYNLDTIFEVQKLKGEYEG